MVFRLKSIILISALLSTGYTAISANDELPNYVTTFLQDTTLKAGKTYSNGFESLSAFKDFYITPQNHMGSATHTLTQDIKHSGKSAHKAWIYKRNAVAHRKNTNHRAYPTFQMANTELGILKEKAFIEFWVWVDIPLYNKVHQNWFSLATFTSYADNSWHRSYLVNVDKEYRVHLMHAPQQGQAEPDIYQNTNTKIPQKQWVKISIFIDYTKNNRFNSPFISVWQNTDLMSASRLNDRIDPYFISPKNYPKCMKAWDIQSIERACNLDYTGGLAQMHFGLYTPPLLSRGTIYNDDLKISEVIRH